MKKFISVLTLALSFHFSSTLKAQGVVAPDMNPNAPEIMFENEVVDYGVIEYDANGIREFKFKNTGKSPLVITAVTGECGCTSTTINGKPGWPTEPILPGKSGVIKIKYDTKREGRFEKGITVTSNARSASKKIRVKGEVKGRVMPTNAN